ncbi:MAG: aryl-sulfate sulfotransferase [Nocardioides sp.]
MHRVLAIWVALALGLALAPLGGSTAAAVTIAAAPQHGVTVAAGVEMYPSFDPTITRYGLVPNEATSGTVTVTASTEDPEGVVRVNGRVAEEGERTLTGLAAGDEISVLVDDSAGRTAYSLIYLPPGFPALEQDTAIEADPSPGMVLLTLSMWTDGSPAFETAVDPHGVPVYVRESAALDLKSRPGGGYSVARNTTTPGGTGYDIVELDDRFEEVARHHTRPPVVNTDGHDAVLLPDGSIYFLSYEDDAASGLTDTIVQHVAADGEVLFTWNSADHVDIPAETVVGTAADYAHSNSIQVLEDGDLLVSFRHFSSAFKIARTSHDGYAQGEVVWRLGGRASDFTFTDGQGQPDGGPCAQHTVYEVAPDRFLAFDNGSGFLSQAMCIDPADPSGEPIVRPRTRVVEWEIDEEAGTAREVSSYAVPGRYALFAGSAQRLDTGHTLIGWAAANEALATEIDGSGNVVWELRDPAADRRPDLGGNQRFFTYRAFKADVPDTQQPEVSVEVPAPGQTFDLGERTAPDATCTDRGGSTLQTCETPELDTETPGEHDYVVTATDGAGNTTTATVSYTVDPAPAPARPDAMLKRPGGHYVGEGVTSWPAKHRVTTPLPRAGSRARVKLRVRNTGEEPGRFTVRRTRNNAAFTVTLAGSTKQQVRTPVVAPGRAMTITVRVRRTARAERGDRRDVSLKIRSAADRTLRDAVVVRARAVRR